LLVPLEMKWLKPVIIGASQDGIIQASASPDTLANGPDLIAGASLQKNVEARVSIGTLATKANVIIGASHYGIIQPVPLLTLWQIRLI